MTEVMTDIPDTSSGYCKVWEVIVGSFIGGVFLTIADLMFNKKNSITGQIANFVSERNIMSLDKVWLELIAFCLMIMLGLGLCFVYRPQSRSGAFARGSSVIAVLTIMNIGATVIAGPAKAQQLDAQGYIVISLEKPQAYGPLGIGTLINGDSDAVLQKINVTGMNIGRLLGTACDQPVEIGSQRFCAVGVGVLTSELRAKVRPTGASIWVRQ